MDKRPAIDLIKDAKKISEENGEVTCIYDSGFRDTFSWNGMTKSVIRNSKIDSILGDDFFIDSSEFILSFPSIPTYYDTETDSSDILTRHQRVIEFLDYIEFKPSNILEEEFNIFNVSDNNTKYECSFYSESIKNVIITICPNLLTKIKVMPLYSHEFNEEFTLFFNKNEIIRIVEKHAPVEWKREIKINRIIN
jgi:hypothetical protein